MNLNERISLIQICLGYDVFNKGKLIQWVDNLISKSSAADSWMIDLSLYKGNSSEEVLNVLIEEFGYPKLKSFSTLIATLNFCHIFGNVSILQLSAKLSIDKDHGDFIEETKSDLEATCTVGKVYMLLEEEHYSEEAVNSATNSLNELFKLSSRKYPEIEDFLTSVA